MTPPGAKGPPPLPAGAPGNAVLKCKWKLHVTVHSQERFWPKDSFDVRYGSVGASVAADPLLPPIPGPWYKQAVKMSNVDSSEVLFEDSGHKDGGVTAMVHDLKKEADWVLVDGIKSTNLLAKQYVPQTMDDGQDNKVDLFIRHPLNVYLEFKFKDPESNIYMFPKDFPIQVWDDKQVLEKKTDEKGRVDFEVDRVHDWITLKFGNGPVYFAVNDAKAGKCDLKVEADRKQLAAKDVKFFGPPETWGLIESVWKFSEEPKFIDASVARKDEEGKIYLYQEAGKNWVRRIGEKDAPITLTLDPHWQFDRVEFFDRYYGHTDHKHKRVDAPPMLLEAVWKDTKQEFLEGSGQWVLNPASVDDSVHAVPWIRQKTSEGKKSEKPDKDCYIRFKTDADTFSVSSDATTRKLDAIPAGDKRLNPGVDRLKHYDFPPQWESRKYWTRLGSGAKQEGKFWEDWTEPDLLRSRSAKDPLIFSLDDIIVTDTAFNPVKLAKTDRLAVFYHRFKPDYDQTAKTDVSPHGVIKPNANEPYFSDIERKGTDFNYVADYPNWVRLMAGIGSLYDAFDKRTVSGVVGARAGVKWYDPVVSGTPPPAVGTAWPAGVIGFQAPIDKTHFVLEPYFGQSQHIFWKQFNAGGTRIGRFDMALVRNCDRIGAKELFVSMQYFRLFYNFLTAAMATTLNLQASAVTGAAAQTTYIQSSAVGLMDRWNGNDVVSTARGEIVPQDNTKPVTGEVLWFVQPAAGLPDAHFRVDITAGVGRASMGSGDGTGTVDDTYATASSGAYGTQNEYILAHELGHGGSLPDEYAERSTWASGGTAGFSCNTPGDPFVDEGLYPDFTATIYKAANPPYPMMTQTVEMRNRYFWHNAEFARKFIKEPMFAKYGTYPEYKVPGHPNFPRSQYSHWPILNVLNQKLGGKGKADIYLHAAGKERYTLDVLPKGPYDGLVSVLLKLVLYETTGGASKVVWVRNAVRNAIRDYNNRYYCAGDATVLIDDGAGGPGVKKDFSYAKAALRLSPRFALDPVDKTAADPAFAGQKAPKDFKTYQAKYATQVANTLATFGQHFAVNIVDKKAGASGFNAGTGKVDLVVDYADPNAFNTVSSWAQHYFREMVGAPFDPKNPNTLAAADLKAIGQAIFTKNGDVKDL